MQPFLWPLRVYYEDTDAAGVVYYANYLKFLERARTEWLAKLGFSLTQLEAEHRAVFVVHELQIKYRQPARLGESLVITLTIVERGRSRLIAAQDVLRATTVLAAAIVTLACLDPKTWRPTRIPPPLAAHIQRPA